MQRIVKSASAIKKRRRRWSLYAANGRSNDMQNHIRRNTTTSGTHRSWYALRLRIWVQAASRTSSTS